MHVLIADSLPSSVADRLRARRFDVTSDPTLKDQALVEALRRLRPEVLVVRSTKCTAEMISVGCLGLVVRAGAGTNTIDVGQASASGVYVANCPGRNSQAVAELTLGLLVSADRRIPDAVADLRAGRWRKGEYGEADGLAGRTLGIVGLGRIGLAVAKAARGLDMEVLGWNRSAGPRKALEALGGTFCPNLQLMLGQCDVVSLHVAAAPETKGLAGREFFAAMKEGAFLLNTSRAELVDEDALRWALDKKKMRAALDVFEGEGKGDEDTIDVPLLQHPRVWATPHIGASTNQAQQAVADEALRIVTAYRDTGRVPNVVNITERSPSRCLLVVRHVNRVGVLSHVFGALRDASINAAETENIVFEGGRACIARIALDSEPSSAALNRIRGGNDAILSLQVVPITR